MDGLWSLGKARIDNRIARLIATAPFHLRNDRPLVSFTFDDVPKSAVTVAAKMLEEHSAIGTFYVAGGLCSAPSQYWESADVKDIVSLHRRGHEIGCHTFSHVRMSDVSSSSATSEFEQNRRFLRDIASEMAIQNFAYPFGVGSLRCKKLLKSRFRSSRSIFPAVNRGQVDLQFLHAFPLINRDIDANGIDRAFDSAVRDNGWLIFYGHDISSHPSPYGCTADLFGHALRAAAKRGVPVLSIGQALDYAGA